jgi:hypothetical protein
MRGVLVVSAMVAVAGTTGETPAIAAAHGCGDYTARGDQYRKLRAYDTSCRRARSLVRAWANKDSGEGGWIVFTEPAHWRCRLYSTSSGQIIRCKSSRAPARVTFRPGFGP